MACDHPEREKDDETQNLLWSCFPFIISAWDRRDLREVFGRGATTEGNSGTNRHVASANGDAPPRPFAHGTVAENEERGILPRSPDGDSPRLTVPDPSVDQEQRGEPSGSSSPRTSC